jgi:NAD(P)H-flavin reductase
MPGHRMLAIAGNEVDAPSVNTVRFKESMNAAPGQFVMIWVPGVD